MSDQTPHDPRFDNAGATDESLLSAHERELGKKPADNGHYKMLPLVLLFVFSGLIFFAGTYLNEFSGHFDPSVFDEHGKPAQPGAATAAVDPLVLGKRNYDQTCATCHQINGQGVAGIYPPLDGAEWVTGSPERLVHILVYGLKGPVMVKGTEYNAAAMPAFGRVAGSGYNWTDERIAATLTYIRQAWSNQAGPITAEEVAAIRTKEGDRKEMTQEELLQLP
ncbi:MAG: cytochrome c [Opitutus sp.]|nr:cytochrome c [Opitutus sp.]